MDTTLPRAARLRKRREFRRVYEGGVRAPGRYLVVFGLRREGAPGGARIGVTASRRVGGAVARSRCRRRLRELYRVHPGLLAGLDIDVVVNARAGCVEAPWEELRRDYSQCVGRLRERLSQG